MKSQFLGCKVENFNWKTTDPGYAGLPNTTNYFRERTAYI